MQRISSPGQSDLSLEFSVEDRRILGPCACCGEMTSRVWGYAYRSTAAIAAYFVEWTPLHALPQATFDFILGKWGADTTTSHRQAVSVAFRQLDDGPSFMVQDSATRSVASSSLVSRALDRDTVIGTPLAEESIRAL